MRGKVEEKPEALCQIRITPAYAGKRGRNESGQPIAEDHPRVCGEKHQLLTTINEGEGSPPRMRGKAVVILLCVATYRITPAYAGKRIVEFACSCRFQDHPRVCGEKQKQKWREPKETGSPPRMRGKAIMLALPSIGIGITPAYAGKRLKRSRSTVPHAAIVPLFPSVCNKPAGSDGSPAGHDAPPFLPIENAAPASPAYNLRSL